MLVLTTFERDDYVFSALRNGASGFILKNAPPEQLLDAVRVVAAGDALLAPSVTRRMVEEFARRPAAPAASRELSRLTERELEVLTAVSRGLTNAEIAGDLYVGEATVKSHVSSLLSKLGLRDRVQASCSHTSTGSCSRATIAPERAHGRVRRRRPVAAVPTHWHALPPGGQSVSVLSDRRSPVRKNVRWRVSSTAWSAARS